MLHFARRSAQATAVELSLNIRMTNLSLYVPGVWHPGWPCSCLNSTLVYLQSFWVSVYYALHCDILGFWCVYSEVSTTFAFSMMMVFWEVLMSPHLDQIFGFWLILLPPDIMRVEIVWQSAAAFTSHCLSVGHGYDVLPQHWAFRIIHQLFWIWPQGMRSSVIIYIFEYRYSKSLNWRVQIQTEHTIEW